MVNSQFITALKTLNRRELKRFEEFISSPYFNKDENAIALFLYIRKYAPSFVSAKLKKEVIFSNLFKQKAYQDQLMRDLLAKLLKLLLEFMANEEATSEVFTGYFFMVKQLCFRNLYKPADKKLKEINASLATEKYLPENYFHHKSNFLTAQNEVDYMLTISDISKYVTAINFEGISAAFKEEYYFKMLDIYSLWMGLVANNKIEFDRTPFKKVMTEIAVNPASFPLPVQLLYLNIKLTEQHEHTDFYALKKLVIERKNELNRTIKNHVLFSLTNYCIIELRKGLVEFRQESFEIANVRWKEGLVYTHGFIDSHFCYVVLHNAIVLKQFDWVKDFIAKNMNFFHDDFKLNQLDLIMAEFNMATKNYTEAQKILAGMSFQSDFTQQKMRAIYLQIYFETKDYEQFDSMTYNFRKFLRRTEFISDEILESTVNFISLCSALMKCSISKDPVAIAKLKEEIINFNNVALKDWLIEKIEEISH